jgi:hypothetical protein
MAASLLFIFVLAATLGVWGWRGRVLNDHPTCRHCGFDLVGLQLGVDGERSGSCPECGADLAGRRAVRVGQRQRRPALVLLGGALALAAVAVVVTPFWTQRASIRWISYAPSWWLAREARTLRGAAADTAIDELQERVTAGTLSAQTRDLLVADALRFQADSARPWTRSWGGLLDAAHAKGALTAAQTEAYGRRMATLSLARVDVGDGEAWLYYGLDCSRHGLAWHTFKVEVLSVKLDGLAAEFRASPVELEMGAMYSGSGYAGVVTIGASNKPRRLDVRVRCSVRDSLPPNALLATWEADSVGNVIPSAPRPSGSPR